MTDFEVLKELVKVNKNLSYITNILKRILEKLGDM